MSAVAVTISALMAAPAVVAITGNRIVNIAVTEPGPSIVVNVIYEDDWDLLEGASKQYSARVSVECRSGTLPEVQVLGEAVKDALEDIHLEVFNDIECSFFKDGSDVSGFAADASVGQRVIDFSVEWRRLA